MAVRSQGWPDVPIAYPLIAGLDSWNSYENDRRGHH